MRTILLSLLLSIAVAASALPQAGPEKTEPKKKKAKREATADTARADTTRAEPDEPTGKKAAPDSAQKPTPRPDSTVVPTVPRSIKAPPPAPKPEVPPRAEPVRPGFSRFVPRAVLCRDIQNREPVAPLDSVVTDTDTLWFFTEVADLQGTTISHRWRHEGEVFAEIPMSIGGPHWRVYSRKVMLPAWAGPWTVEVVDEETRVLARRNFVYRPRPSSAGDE